MSASINRYRTLDEDTEDNIESAKKPLEIPVLVMASPPPTSVAGRARDGKSRPRKESDDER